VTRFQRFETASCRLSVVCLCVCALLSFSRNSSKAKSFGSAPCRCGFPIVVELYENALKHAICPNWMHYVFFFHVLHFMNMVHFFHVGENCNHCSERSPRNDFLETILET
jgi:hypothetical protein